MAPGPGRPPGLRRGIRRLVLGVHGQVEDFLLLAPEHGQDPVRGQPGERLGEIEVVGELGAARFLSGPHPGHEPPHGPHPLAQLTDQVGVLTEPLHQNGAGPVQGSGYVGDAAVRVDVWGSGLLRVVVRLGEQQVGQRLQAGFAGDLRLRAPLRLVGQVDVFQPRLGVGRHDPLLERVVELALGLDRLQDRGPPLVELPQVTQPLLERPQLGVIQRPGHFLAVAGDERHRGPAIEQLDRRGDLSGPDTELVGDPAADGQRDHPRGAALRRGSGGRLRFPARRGNPSGRVDRLLDGLRHVCYPLSR